MNKVMYIYAILTGIINSAIGSGGGMLSVPAMKKYGLDQKKAQATTIAVILPITVISAVLYALKDYYTPSDSFKYIPFGFLGAVIGVRITKKINGLFLRKLFSLFMIWAGYRMLFR